MHAPTSTKTLPIPTQTRPDQTQPHVLTDSLHAPPPRTDTKAVTEELEGETGLFSQVCVCSMISCLD